MRIVAGAWRGRAIEAPQGRGVTRPTTERVREAAASMLLSARSLSLDDARVFDAFAGSGALGLELLSRGAAWCTFVDADRAAAERVRRNAATLGAAPLTYAVVQGEVERLARTGALVGRPFDIVVLDPPYAASVERVCALIEALVASDALAHDALVLYERSAQAPPSQLPFAHVLRQKRYAQTAVELFRLTMSPSPLIQARTSCDDNAERNSDHA